MEMRLLLCGGLVFAVFTAFHVLGEDTTATICGGFIYKGPCNDTIVRASKTHQTRLLTSRLDFKYRINV
ncbi:uncharacterized protein LOC142587140 isoform X2 [Dermacentor variabilis]|uniref:uncharacterized protein LOC142587140 isoform X2 n=1 Tax=Dermacentor variabilis TaxID=34621 RepID=UPI003F5B5631